MSGLVHMFYGHLLKLSQFTKGWFQPRQMGRMQLSIEVTPVSRVGQAMVKFALVYPGSGIPHLTQLEGRLAKRLVSFSMREKLA